MNAHNPPPGVREAWRRMKQFERIRFTSMCGGACLITCGVTMIWGLAGFFICVGAAVIVAACLAEDQ